ncbi:uncharacterized protein RSE6_03840 [Rhynchosporium secalis]|uniref:Heterokaryon incompatibility domain-containing protein n=1 Tax=Rhynchosporium secalis TaxID=38038 RepID=A0A1E1M3S0_RHYSE|nr:uncharacterized protein RSE6_03840 [Rhynchosporium secalis]
MPPYTSYRTLTPHPERIRLLHVLPEKEDASAQLSKGLKKENLPPSSLETLVACTLSHASLVDRPVYDALSYTWGDASLTTPILIDGSIVEVTKNLEAALRHLRLKDRTLTLWVDAVCINQQNDMEKSEQLEHMRPIYAQAIPVVAWLGPAADDSDIAMQWIDDFGTQACALGIGTKPTLQLRHILKGSGERKSKNSADASIENFVHELGEQFSATNPRAACPYMRFGCPTKALAPLIYLLRSLRRFQATDPRDKAFALYGIAGDTRAHGFYPDYSKSCKDVFTNLARVLIRNGYIELLSMCEFPKMIGDLPSWVPDWSREVYRRAPLQQRALVRSTETSLTVLEPSFSASGITEHTEPEVRDVIGRNMPLLLSGTLFGDVRMVGRSWEAGHVNTWLSDLSVLYQDISDADKPTTRRGLVVWQMAIADQEIRQGTKKPRLSERNLLHLEQTLMGEDPCLMDAAKLVHLGLGDYCLQLCDVARGRRPICVSGSFLGIGPDETEPGDLAFVLHGSDVPYILRRNKDDNELRLVGEAYIHGIMDGEAVGQGEEPRTVTVF